MLQVLDPFSSVECARTILVAEVNTTVDKEISKPKVDLLTQFARKGEEGKSLLATDKCFLLGLNFICP
jgi:hypothetical protein